MYSKSDFTTLALLPQVQPAFGQPLLQVSTVFYFDQLPDHTFEFGFKNLSALELDSLGYEMIGSPILVPHNYTSAKGRPDLKNHTSFGPRKAIPEEALDGLVHEDNCAIFVTMSLEAVEDEKLTVSAIWVEHHSLLDAIGDAPACLEWFNAGVYPWNELSLESFTTTK